MGDGIIGLIKTYLRALRRRLFLILSIFVIGSAAGVSLAFLLPPVYQSTARILVESQQIPEELARSTVTASAAERLQLIEQRLMTRDNLLSIVDELNLFADRPGLSPTKRVEAIRNSTTFQSIELSGNGRNRQVSGFVISYKGNNAATVSRVANEFVTRVLEQNVQARSERATETTDFFESEVERLGLEITRQEAKISGFKNENIDALPQSYEFRLQEASTLQDRIFAAEQRKTTLDDERRELVKAVEEGKSLPSDRPLTPEEQQLRELQRSLVQQRSVLAESHPQIQALRRRIAAIEASIQSDGSTGEEGVPSFDPLSQTRRQIALLERELTNIEELIERDRGELEALKETLDRTPRIEIELSAMERALENLRGQYDRAVSRLAEAAIGERLEVNRQAERFEVIEQARVPEAPVAPPRKLIAAGSVVGSLLVGIALALLLEILNPMIRTSADLQNRLDLRPVITVPYIETTRERFRRRMKKLFWLLLIAGVVPAALWAVDQHYLPLSVLIERLSQMTGLEQVMQSLGARIP